MASGRTLDELASAVGGRVLGDGSTLIAAVRSLDGAGAGDLAFLREVKHLETARASRAAALLVPSALAGELSGPRLAVEDPDTAVARVLEILHPAARPEPGVHPTAVVEEGAAIDVSAHLGPYAVVGAGSVVGPRSAVLAHAVVGRGCRLGEEVTLHPHVVLYDRTVLGDRVTVHAGTILGADGFGYASAGGVHRKVPQVGRTVIEDDVEIGALSAVDRAALEETRIGAGTKIDNLVQVGHNVVTGRGCILCGQVGIAGSATLGDYVVLGGQVGVVGHVPISSQVQVGGKSMAAKPYEVGQVVAGIPAIDIKESHRQKLRLARLGDVMRRLRDLEKRVEALGGTETNEEASD